MMITLRPPRRPAPKVNKHSVTSIDVARLAEVSQSAVSRSFTPGASVAPETRARVLEAARKLGYRPNAIASTLSSRRSRMIAVVLSNLQNQFYPVVIEALSQRLQKDGYHVLLFVTETEDADELLVELLRYQVDGIVMASTHLSSGLAQQIADARIPVVMFNRTSSKGRISTVSSDNHGGGRAVANFLADGGHQRVAYIAGAEDSSTSHDRETGPRDGLAERGLRVPEDVSVVGVDNVPQADWGACRLSTVEQSVVPMIEATVQMLLQQLEDDAVTRDHVVVPTRLVLRSSARLPRNVSASN